MNQEQALDIIKKKRGKKPIAEGSSRKVYEIDGYILKKSKNKRGILECHNENWLHSHIEENYQSYLCPVLYYEEGTIIMKKAELMDFEYFEEHIKEPVQPLIEFLFKQYGIDDFDLGCSFNWGLLNGKPVIIDYGHNYFGDELGE